MGRISGKINLSALEHSVQTSKKGVKFIAIPIEKNNLFQSDKGNVYLDISCNEHLNSEKKQTHIVNQSVPKEVYEKLKEAGEYAPSLGNLTDWDKLGGGGGESAPNVSTEDMEMDDLPF